MNNIEKLTQVGLIAPDTTLSPDEIAALASMSDPEIAALVGDRLHVGHEADEPRLPTYHVIF